MAYADRPFRFWPAGDRSQELAIALAPVVEARRPAAAAGDPDALYELATFLSEGLGVPRDPAQALELLQRAAKAGHQGAACAVVLREMAAKYDKFACLRLEPLLLPAHVVTPAGNAPALGGTGALSPGDAPALGRKDDLREPSRTLAATLRGR